MISLFLGEFYRLKLARRLLLIPAGFLLAMVFNVCRMTFLAIVAAKKGVAAIAQYHDPAGIMITLVCTAGLWGLAVLLSKKQKVESRKQKTDVTGQKSAITSEFQLSDFPISAPRSDLRPPSSGVFVLSVALLLWLGAVEAGTELWYGRLESHRAPSPEWSVRLPTDNPTFKTLPISADTAYRLRFDEGQQGAWMDSDGSRWQAFCFSWWPGRVAGYLAKRHTPEACLPASGREMVSGPELTMMNIHGVALPVRSYVFGTKSGALYVFHCRWEAGANEDAYVAQEGARFNLIRAIWAGRGKYGQKTLEIIVSGYADSAQAKAAFARQLQTLIQVEKPAQLQTSNVSQTLY
jgi:exosortase/archaeosortase family protein